MTQQEISALMVLTGQLLPPFIDGVNRYVPSSKVRFLITLAICLLMGVSVNAGQLQLSNLLGILNSATLVFASSQAAYKFYYQDSQIHVKLRNLY